MDAVTPGYKLTDAGVIPEGWEAVRLGDIARIGSGTTPSRNQHALYFAKGKIPWIKTGDLNNSVLEATDECVTDVARVECNLTIYPVGTVVIAMYGGFNQIGRTGLLTMPATVNQAISAVCPDAKRIDSKYLVHHLNFFVDRWKDIASSSRKDPNITRKDVSTFQVALPPLAEQRAIAAALGDLDGLIAASGRGIAKRRDLKQAAMQQLLTGRTRLPGFADPWATRKLGDVFDFLKTANNSRADLNDCGELIYVHYGDIHTLDSSFLDFERVRPTFIDAVKGKGIPRLQDGDLIMVDASEDYVGVGKSAEVRGLHGREAIAGLHTLLMRGDKRYVADGYKAYLQCIPAVKMALERLATGISVYGISKSNIKNVEIDLPPLTEQRAIAAVLADFDAELAALEAERAKWRLVKQGAMQELLTGRTRLV